MDFVVNPSVVALWMNWDFFFLRWPNKFCDETIHFSENKNNSRMQEHVLNFSIKTMYFVFSDAGRSSLSMLLGKIKTWRKLFISLPCLAFRQESEKFVSEPGRQFISLSPTQNLWLWESREIWFHDMVSNGAFYQH